MHHMRHKEQKYVDDSTIVYLIWFKEQYTVTKYFTTIVVSS